MATSQTEVESQVAELATEAFNIFCDDIGGMFGVGMQCEQKEVRSETVQGLKKRFKKLVAVNVVQSEGSLSGTFQLIFDQEGLFTLGGIIVMLPEQRILANRRDPSPELAASMVDAVAEAGNLLVGSWDRVFREGLKKHGHFLQRLPAFVGRPWDEPKEKIGLAADEDLLYIAYEMTIGSYPAFNCGVILPKTIFGGSSDLPRDDGVLTQNDSQDAETVPQAQDNAGEADQKPVGAEATPAQKAQAEEKSPETPSNNAPAGKAKPKQADAAQKREGGKSKSKRRAAGKTARKKANVTAAAGETGAEETTEAKAAEAQIPPTSVTTSEKNEDPATGEISETIRRMTQSPAVLPGESGQPSPAAPESTDLASQPSPAAPELTDLPGQPATPECAPLRASASDGLLSMPARDVMKDQVVWAAPEETVQQALAKMQQHDTGYLMIGRDGMLEGMVSRSDIAGALSPYLRSIFAKWRRPLDDATLKIKIKWIMSRPVRTVRPETPLATIMENVCRFGGRAVPVVDEQGKVQGLVTVFDVFQTLLKTCDDVSTVGNAPQSPPLT
jgi:CBS domain-containing protein